MYIYMHILPANKVCAKPTLRGRPRYITIYIFIDK